MRIIVMCLALALVTTVIAQTPDEATRKLWDTAFTASSTKKKTAHKRRSAYRIATPNVPVDNVVPDTVVGVTIWRLRPATRSDSGERLIVHDDKSSTENSPHTGQSSQLFSDPNHRSAEFLPNALIY